MEIFIVDVKVYSSSKVNYQGSNYSLALKSESREKVLCVFGSVDGFTGEDDPTFGRICPLSPANAQALRARLPWLNPVPLGLHNSAGFGDRLGLATPGHVRAVQGTPFLPIFAQQSVRENVRTRRTPQQVLDDAMWGVFQEGWKEPWGADADHLKSPADLPAFIEAGYSFFTIDPGDHVFNAPEEDFQSIQNHFEALPWDILETTPQQLLLQFTSKPIHLPGLDLVYSPEILIRAAAKYASAVSHAVNMYRALTQLCGSKQFDLEVSLDETDQPTSIYEHYYVASELHRLSIPFNSLALRFPGRLEKGVDYIGDLTVFEADLARHALIRNHFGTYKLSLHSGSDKFSLYPQFAKYAPNSFHLKTAGTSYLEALRVIAVKDPNLFRQIAHYSVLRYPTDRVSYHVSAHPEAIRPISDLKDDELCGLLDQFDAREVLHVAFGSVLDQYGNQIRIDLKEFEAEYVDGLVRHFQRHLSPFHQA
jgi:hypothetical protein